MKSRSTKKISARRLSSRMRLPFSLPESLFAPNNYITFAVSVAVVGMAAACATHSEPVAFGIIFVTVFALTLGFIARMKKL